jgi:hypothetical protein
LIAKAVLPAIESALIIAINMLRGPILRFLSSAIAIRMGHSLDEENLLKWTTSCVDCKLVNRIKEIDDESFHRGRVYIAVHATSFITLFDRFMFLTSLFPAPLHESVSGTPTKQVSNGT